MRTQRHHFYSDALRLDAMAFHPDERSASGKFPLVVACSGFTGLYRIHPARFARWLTTRGYMVYSFDYRGQGDSEGTRCRVILEEQVRDIRQAVVVARNLPSVDVGNVFVLGWAMGAGLVIDAVREMAGVRGVVALNGLYDGAAFELAHRGEEGLRLLRERVEADRLRRAKTGVSEYTDPYDIYPLDADSRRYVESSLEPVHGYEDTAYSFDLAESLLRWSVLPVAPAIDLPMFVAHGDNNQLHPADQAIALQRAYGGPCDMNWLEGAGHTEWMADDNPLFQKLCRRLLRWLENSRLSAAE